MTICLLTGGKHRDVPVTLDEDGRVHFIADADIDADGANGLNGKPAAYRADDHGSELLANGGMKRGGPLGVTWAAEWGKDIVLQSGGQPMVLADGTIPSRTAYHFPGKSIGDPSAYVDAANVPYIVVSPKIILGVAGIVLGCRARVTYKGLSVECVVADVGPRGKCGELSIAAAEAVGIPSSPRTGGEENNIVEYELWPGVAAIIGGVAYPLQRAA